jgi:ribonuclease P protein component
MPAQGLPADRKLRRRREFQRVFDQGRRTHGRFVTLIAAPTDAAATRLGIVASRKLGGAVVRNRAKRLIREMFRKATYGGRPVDLVVIPKNTLLTADVEGLKQDYANALRRCLSNL